MIAERVAIRKPPLVGIQPPARQDGEVEDERSPDARDAVPAGVGKRQLPGHSVERISILPPPVAMPPRAVPSSSPASEAQSQDTVQGQGAEGALAAETPADDWSSESGARVSFASRFGHAFGRISILPRAADDPPTIQRAPDPAAPTTAPGDGTPSQAGDGAVPLDNSGAASGSTTIQNPPAMQSTLVHGTTLAEVAAALPDESGAVDFDFSVATKGEPTTAATLEVKQTMTLPQWAERDKAPQAAQRSWDRFLSALRQHENGHVAIDMQMFTGAHRRFVGIPAAQVQQTSDQLRADVQAKQDAFDAQTDHGRKGNPPTVLDTGADADAGGAPKSATADDQTTPGAADLVPGAVPDSGPPSLQARLFISAADDPYEREANAVADRVMRRAPDEPEAMTGFAHAEARVQRLCAQCAKALDEGEGELCPECAAKAKQEEGGVRLSRKEAPDGADHDGRVPPIVGAVLQSGGEPLEQGTRAEMEGRFGHDFSRVRIFADTRAAASARAINAQAYTVGEQVVFGAGHYAPQSESGRWLLAHELTHVLQQRGEAMAPPGSAAGSAIQREEDKKEDFDTEQRRLIRDAKTVGDVKDINAQAFHLASDDDRFRLIGILLNQGWVGPRDEYYLERIWASFGKNLQDAAHKGFALWNQCVDRGADLWDLSELIPIKDKFKADVAAKTRGYLAKNRTFIQEEQKRLGLDNPQAAPTAAQTQALVDIKQVAKDVADAEGKQAALKHLTVGYDPVVNVGDDPGISKDPKQQWTEKQFNPDTPPKHSGPVGFESGPMPTWEATNTEYKRLEAMITGFANRYPTIYALRRDDKINDVANGKDDTKTRQTIATSLQGVLDNIATTEGKLADPKSTLPLELHPIHQQLYNSPGPWQDPFSQAVAKKTIEGYEDAEWWKEMGVTALQLALFAVAELATGGAATVFFLALGAGVGVARAEQSWEKYQEKSAAAKSNVSDETKLLESGEADAAFITAVLDTATAFLDVYAAGSAAVREASTLKQLEERLATAEAKEAESAIDAELKQKQEWKFTDEVTGEAHTARATDRGLEICTECDLIARRMRDRFSKLPGTPSAETEASLKDLIAKAETNSNAWKDVKKELDAVEAERDALKAKQGGKLDAPQQKEFNQKLATIKEKMGRLEDASQKLEDGFEALGREHKVGHGLVNDEGMTLPHGGSDVEVRKSLGIPANEPCADKLAHDAAGKRWVIAESKGDDIPHALEQLENTERHLVAHDPTATNVEFRVYPSPGAYKQMQTPEGLGLSRYGVNEAGLLTQNGAVVQAGGRSVKILPPPD